MKWKYKTDSLGDKRNTWLEVWEQSAEGVNGSKLYSVTGYGKMNERVDASTLLNMLNQLNLLLFQK